MNDSPHVRLITAIESIESTLWLWFDETKPECLFDLKKKLSKPILKNLNLRLLDTLSKIEFLDLTPPSNKLYRSSSISI